VFQEWVLLALGMEVTENYFHDQLMTSDRILSFDSCVRYLR